MKHEAQAQPEDALITLEGEDGKSYSCQLLNIFDFENQEYALLLKAEDDKGAAVDPKNEEGSLVIMRLIERDDQSIFQTIESDEEFERVVAHVEQLAKQFQSEAAGQSEE